MKSENKTPSFLFNITQFLKLKKGNYLTEGLNFSFSDLGCFNLEFDILQSKIRCELTEL